MTQLARLSFSIEQGLANRLEELVKTRGYTNRSEFIRDMIRDRLVEETWAVEGEGVGAITLIYDHHGRQLTDRLTHIQHHHHEVIMATTHVHLDEHLCVEVILVKGRVDTIRSLADQLRKQRGVLHGGLSMSASGHALR
ncbi:MAG TPA: nickel-responsive transcriptional regulator NikR [Thermoanaerobaculia bacterium]|nr:nickel-responsive transcriptional regulator NikR [Thermoanaerobaculia bacterium]HUM30870.1 nickel-responsive transcriptional regulator NikR [Thermoanaerobaculia bacterium]HXK69229.1 nickel-responsive transcriptional regulator NikR [Thermoanaerobaculia bacterium]